MKLVKIKNKKSNTLTFFKLIEWFKLFGGEAAKVFKLAVGSLKCSRQDAKRVGKQIYFLSLQKKHSQKTYYQTATNKIYLNCQNKMKFPTCKSCQTDNKDS